jgi:hypothetical protein
VWSCPHPLVARAESVAAATARLRRVGSPMPFPPRTRPQICPPWACGPFPPLLQPRTAASSLESGYPHRQPPQGPHCKALYLSMALSAKKGYICDFQNISRDLIVVSFLNSEWCFADSCKIRKKFRKIRKMQTHFFAFLVKKPTTFFWKQLWGKAPQQHNILIREEEPANLQRTSKEGGREEDT